MGGLFPARGLLVVLGGFSLGLLVALGGFSLGLLVALGGFSLGLFVALGGFSLGFLGDAGDASSGCFSFLGLLSFLPFFPLSLAFSRSAVQDADLGQINGEPTLCPISPRHRGLQPGTQAFYIKSAVTTSWPGWLSSHGAGPCLPTCPNLNRGPSRYPLPHMSTRPVREANLCWTWKVQR